jgi:hypothetical protein
MLEEYVAAFKNLCYAGIWTLSTGHFQYYPNYCQVLKGMVSSSHENLLCFYWYRWKATNFLHLF